MQLKASCARKKKAGCTVLKIPFKATGYKRHNSLFNKLLSLTWNFSRISRISRKLRRLNDFTSSFGSQESSEICQRQGICNEYMNTNTIWHWYHLKVPCKMKVLKRTKFNIQNCKAWNVNSSTNISSDGSNNFYNTYNRFHSLHNSTKELHINWQHCYYFYY